jgi:hypothetical protein
MVEIDGVNTAFVSGRAFVGFGSSDITVKQLWVTGPTRIVMNVAVNPLAQPGSAPVTVACGLELLNWTSMVQVQTANPKQIALIGPVTSYATGLAGLQPGEWAIVYTSGVPTPIGSGWTVTVGGISTAPQFGVGGLLAFPIPNGLPAGPASVQLVSPNGDEIPPVPVQIDGPPPVIVGAVNLTGVPIDNNHPVKQGDTIVVTVSRLTDSAGDPAPLSKVRVNVGGMDQTAVTELSNSQSGLTQLQVVLGPTVPYGPAQPLWVGVETRRSAPVPLNIRPQ